MALVPVPVAGDGLARHVHLGCDPAKLRKAAVPDARADRTAFTTLRHALLGIIFCRALRYEPSPPL